MKTNVEPVDETVIVMEAVAIIATLDSVIEQTSAIKKLTEKYPNFSEKIIRQELKRLHKKKKPSACNAEMPEDIGKAFDLPVGVHVPSRYRVMECGVYALEARGEKHIEYTKIIHTPIVVAKKAKDNESGVVGVQLYFLYDEKPRVVNVDQEVIASNTKIMQLANHGVGVTSNNSARVVDYLNEQQFESLTSLPEVITISKSGWSTVGDKSVFAWGAQIVSSVDDVCLERQGPLQNLKTFRAWAVAGDFYAWLKIFQWAKQYPVVFFLFGASLATPLIELLGLMNFVIHVWENSTAGKTAAAQFALSIYGCAKSDALLQGWRTTDNGLESRFRANNGLPMCIDDNSQAKNQDVVNEIIYLIGNGGGKQRADKNGNARAIQAYHGIAFSNGEKPCSTSNTFQGQAVRMIEVKANPFGERNADLGKKVRELKNVVTQNYGHVGAKWLKILVDIANDEQKLEQFKVQYINIREKCSKNVTNSYVLRTIDHVAVVELALTFVAKEIPELLITAHDVDQAVKFILDNQRNVLDETNNVDVKALAYIWNQISSSPDRFDDLGKGIEQWGRLVQKKDGCGKNQIGYAILPVKLEEILIRGGFNFRSSADYFKTNKWVWLKDGQLWTFKMGSQSIRGYVFDHDAAVKCGVISEKGDEDDAVTGIVTSQKPLNGSPVQFGDDELSFCGAVTK